MAVMRREMTKITKQSDRTSVFVLSVDSKEILQSTYAHEGKYAHHQIQGNKSLSTSKQANENGKTDFKTITVLIFTDSLKCVTAKQIKTNTRHSVLAKIFYVIYS